MSSRFKNKYTKSQTYSRAHLIIGSPASVKRPSSVDLRAVTSTIAIAAALSLGGLVGAPVNAWAGSCTAGPASVCSGAESNSDVGQSIGGAGLVSVTTATGFGLTAGGTAIDINSSGGISFTDNNASAITGTAGRGIQATNSGSGSVAIDSNGLLTGGIDGLRVDNSGTDVTVKVHDTKGGFSGTAVFNNGSGATKITSSGQALGGSDSGIHAENRGAATDLTIDAVDAKGDTGVKVVNDSVASGDTKITVTGTATGTGGDGVSVITGAASKNTDVAVNNAVGGALARGIQITNNGTGTVGVTSTGTLTGGIDGVRIDNNTGTDVTVKAKDTNGGYSGIAVFNKGTGSTAITSTGKASGGGGAGTAGIYVENSANTTGLTINAVDSKGNTDGIFALDRGTGATTITSTGTASGGTAKGIHAIAYGTGLTVTSNNASGGQDGIYTEYYGTGTTTITTTGLTEGGAHGIHALSTGQAITINNSGTVRNRSDKSTDQAIFTNGPSKITNTGLITGTVQLTSNLGNTVNNSGTWDTAGGTNEFGAGTASNGVNNTGTIIAAKDGAAVANTVFNNVGTFKNGGLLTMGDGGTGDTTTIDGNYVGDGGTVELDTKLGDDSSPTDKLVITGNATGSTTLAINNVGGLGAQTKDGIETVVVGGTSDAGAFKLAHAVAAGAYDYGLYMGGVSGKENNWFLRSTNELNSEAQTTVVYAGALSHFAQATLGTLQQRTGGRIWPNGGSQVAADLPSDQVMKYAPGGPVIYGQGAWGRVAGLYASYDPKKGGAYTQGIGFLQAGYEGTAYETTNGEVTLGAYATVGRSWVTVDTTRDPITRAARSKGKITSNGYGVGVNATWLGNDGLYADAIGQFTWYDTTLSSKSGSSQGWASALSLEVGKRFDVGSGWSVVPQAQLSWTHVDFSSFTDTLGNRVSIGDGDSVLGRLGVRVENLASWKGEDGETRRLQFYGIANLSYEFMGDTSVKIAGSTVEQQDKRLWGEIGTGATYAWNDKSSVYAEASYGHALASGDNYTAKGTVGFRYKW